jgi:hypothetical protein
MILLYTTTDPRFALHAVEAFRAAGIGCSTNPALGVDAQQVRAIEEPSADAGTEPPDETPGEATDQSTGTATFAPASVIESSTTAYASPFLRGQLGIAIFADRAADCQRASAILLRLGAVREPTISADSVATLNRWVIAFAVITALVVVLYVWQNR